MQTTMDLVIAGWEGWRTPAQLQFGRLNCRFKVLRCGLSGASPPPNLQIHQLDASFLAQICPVYQRMDFTELIDLATEVWGGASSLY